MMHLPQRVPLKATACFLQQFFGHGQVDRRAIDVAMAQIGRKMREKPLDVLALDTK